MGLGGFSLQIRLAGDKINRFGHPRMLPTKSRVRPAPSPAALSLATVAKNDFRVAAVWSESVQEATFAGGGHREMPR
jgi:hypothetical protein